MHGMLIVIFLSHHLALVIQRLIPTVEHLFSTLLACGRAGSIVVDFFVSASKADVFHTAAPFRFSPNYCLLPEEVRLRPGKRGSSHCKSLWVPVIVPSVTVVPKSGLPEFV
jgi:hypothetical protein